MEKYFLFIFLAFVCEILGTISGFGSSILFVPIASLYFDFKSVLGITAVFHVFSNLSKIILFREGIDRNIALKLGVPAVLFVLLGAVLTTYIAAPKMELMMNIALLIVALFLMFNFEKPLEQSNKNLYVGGTISGFLAGLLGTGGAIRGITLAAFHLPKNIFIATSAVIDLGVDSSRAIVYLYNGYFDKKYIILIPFLILISVLGSAVGKWVLQRTSEKAFRYLVLLLIMATSILQGIHYFST